MLLTDLWTISISLKTILCETGSQCSSFKIGVIWHDFLDKVTTRAAMLFASHALLVTSQTVTQYISALPGIRSIFLFKRKHYFVCLPQRHHSLLPSRRSLGIHPCHHRSPDPRNWQDQHWALDRLIRLYDPQVTAITEEKVILGFLTTFSFQIQWLRICFRNITEIFPCNDKHTLTWKFHTFFWNL